MNDVVTDLIPYGRKKVLQKQYWFRLGTVAVLLATALFIIAAILLTPTYALVQGTVSQKKALLSASLTSSASIDEKLISSRLADLKSQAHLLESFAHAPSVSSRILKVLSLPRAGIVLTGFTYAPSIGGQGIKNTLGTMSISGKALTRDALHSFQLALQNAPFVQSAILPVSAYAPSVDVPFTISVTLTP